MAALSLTRTAGASAVDLESAQTQAFNASDVHETVDLQTYRGIANEPAEMQNSVDESSETFDTDDFPMKITQTSSVQIMEAAAGEPKAAASFTLAEIKDASARVKSYIETNKKLPDYVTLGTNQVKMPAFLKLLTASLLDINNGKTAPITLKTVNAPSKPAESVKSGNITKTNYLDLAKRVNAFIDTNGAAPNYADSTLGKIRYENLIYIFSRILNFHKTNSRLPEYVTVTPWSISPAPTPTPTPVPEDLQQYLKATTNCQVNDAQIKALAAEITKGKTSTYDKAVAIFNWVNDHTTYADYPNTRKGAVDTLKAKKGNCCDLSHLVIALERAAGIPARYVHGYCKFLNGKFIGHVWAQVWVNGKWYTADASWSTNTFGVVNNWNTATAVTSGKNYGTFASLPF